MVSPVVLIFYMPAAHVVLQAMSKGLAAHGIKEVTWTFLYTFLTADKSIFLTLRK